MAHYFAVWVILSFLTSVTIPDPRHVVCKSCSFLDGSDVNKVKDTWEARIEDFPYVAALIQKAFAGRVRVECIATIIKPDAALTLAHCLHVERHNDISGQDELVELPPDHFQIAAGSPKPIELDKVSSDAVIRDVECCKYFRGRKLVFGNLYEDDIAILSFESLPLNNIIGTVNITTTNYWKFKKQFNNLVTGNMTCHIASYKLTKTNHSQATFPVEPRRLAEPQMGYLQISFEPEEKCAFEEPEAEGLNLFCANAKNPKEGLCNSVPGAPLVCNGKLYGLYTIHTQCPSIRRHPSLFIYVGKYAEYYGLSDSPSEYQCNYMNSTSRPTIHYLIFHIFDTIIIIYWLPQNAF